MGFSNVCMSLFLDGSRIMAAEKGSPFFLRFYFVKKTEKLPLPVCTRTAFGSFPAEKSILFLLPQSEVFDYFSSQDQSGGRGDKGNAARELRGGMSHQGAVRLSQQEKAPVLGNKPPCSVLSPSFLVPDA